MSYHQYSIKYIQKPISDFDETAGILSKNQVGMIRQDLKQIFEISLIMKTSFYTVCILYNVAGYGTYVAGAVQFSYHMFKVPCQRTKTASRR